MHIFAYTASVIALWLCIVLAAFGVYGCGGGGGDDEPEVVAAPEPVTQTTINCPDSGDATISVPAEEVDEAVDEALEQFEGASVEEFETPTFDNEAGVIRLAKTVIVQVPGCGNTIVISDDDLVNSGNTTNVLPPAAAE